MEFIKDNHLYIANITIKFNIFLHAIHKFYLIESFLNCLSDYINLIDTFIGETLPLFVVTFLHFFFMHTIRKIITIPNTTPTVAIIINKVFQSPSSSSA